MLSLLITTRNRVKSLERLLNSVVDNSNKCEIIIGYDEDDIITESFLSKFDRCKIIPLVNKISAENFCSRCNSIHVNRHKDILNPMARMASGDYLWGLNDDTEIMSHGFDELITDYIESFLHKKQNRLLYGKTNEVFRIRNRGLHQQSDFQTNFACYPILTKETIEILGFFVPDKIFGCNADTTLGTIFHKSSANRFLHIKDVTLLDHIEESVINTNIRPVCTFEYSFNDLQSDINKIDESLEFVEPIDFDYAYVKLAFKCKSCSSSMFIGSNIVSNMITCSECSTPNFIDNRFINAARSFKDLERHISGDLKK